MVTQKTLPKLIAVEQEPVIKMSAEHKKLWMDALRSGEYKQGTGALCDRDPETGDLIGYCCLGVMEMVISGGVDEFDVGDSMCLPRVSWLEAHGITFNGSPIENNPAFMVKFENGETEHTRAPSLNDDGYTFAEIADILEPLIETY